MLVETIGKPAKNGVAAMATALVVSVAMVGACSDDASTEGADCSGDSDCQSDLVCQESMCVTSDGNEDNDNQSDPEPEDYAISYKFLDEQGNKTLHTFATADGTDTELSPDDQACNAGCWLSRDMQHFVWLTPSQSGPNGTFDVNAAPVNAGSVDAASATVVADAVGTARVRGNGITYKHDATAYYKPLDGGSETEVGSLGATGGWFVDPQSDTAMIYEPTLDSLKLKVGTLGEPITEVTYTVQTGLDGTGSPFGSTMPVATSADGKLAAFVTSAPNQYGTCSDASECSGPVKQCGSTGRCIAWELSVRILDLVHLSDLGGPCGGPGTCGDVHECYQPADDTTDATCIPKRVVLGLPKQPYQRATPGAEAQTGCELSEGNDQFHYTDQSGPLSFDSAGNVYTVAQRNCPDEVDGVASNDVGAGDSDIVKIDPKTGDQEVVWGNPTDGYDGDACWDPSINEPTADGCVPYISSAQLSPGGNEFAVRATNPWVEAQRLATDQFDVWTVLRNGDNAAWEPKNAQQTSVSNVRVHPVQ